VTREVPLKEWLIDRHILGPDNALTGNDFIDPVDQQKRVAVRQQLHDLPNIQLHHFSSFNVCSNTSRRLFNELRFCLICGNLARVMETFSQSRWGMAGIPDKI
jgi:hypothetical protein